MFDDGGKWFSFFVQPHNVQATSGLFGQIEDTYHQGTGAHCHLSCNDETMTGGSVKDHTLWITENGYYWTMNGVALDDEGIARKLQTLQWAWDIGASHKFLWEQTNAQANPFSNDEVVHPLLLFRDGEEAISLSEREFTSIVQTRDNLTNLSTFGNVNGSGDSFNLSGSTITLTDSAGLFTADMVGKEITIAGATTGGNNGTFTVTGQTSTTITYENASGATEAFTGTWTVNMAQYLHFRNGLCWSWNGVAI
jgi:hypothetical protein